MIKTAIEENTNRQARRRRKTHLALMRAGADLLAQRPIDAIAVNDIVAVAKVAKGSFFNHFDDKDAFATAIAGEIRAEVEAAVTAANAGVTDPAQRVARAVSGFVRFALAEPKRAGIMLRGQAWAGAGDHPLNRGVQADVATGVATGRFRPGAAKAGVILVAGICQRLMTTIVGDKLEADAAGRLTAAALGLALIGLGVAEEDAEALVGAAVRDVIIQGPHSHEHRPGPG